MTDRTPTTGTSSDRTPTGTGSPGRTRVGQPPARDRAAIAASAAGLVLVVALLGGVVGLAIVGRPGPSDGAAAGSRATGSAAPASFLYGDVADAPPLELIDAEARPVSLASMRGDQVLVFFGYTHCPDVCPVTIGNVGQVLGAVGPGTRALFVTIDPERDTTTWLKEYVRFMPAGFTALTGTAAEIRATADAWGVRYARVEAATKDAYSMSHTADVFLVDAAGRLRAHFPFGTTPEAMTATVMAVAASTPPGAASAPTPSGAVVPPSPSASVGPGASTPLPTTTLRPEVVSTSVWAGGGSPVILALDDASGRLADPSIRATVQLTDLAGAPAGPVLKTTAVRPPGIDRVSYVAVIDVPTPGRWRLAVAAFPPGGALTGSVEFTALDPGGTPALGAPAPTIHTPTLDDAGGIARAVTTDPAPDLRLSRTSTTDALAAHRPFVLVVDSTRFRVTPVCGKAIVMARYLLDRWPSVAFIHLEPFRYHVELDTAVLDGDIANPALTDAAAGWGIGGTPWGALTMPWVFVVDGSGIVRAKYQGLMGSDDVDVILSLLAGD